MDRREVLRALAAATTMTTIAGLTPDRLLALGRQAHGRSATGTWRLFSPHQGATATAVADTIIPATDTPGAREAGVGPFMDFMVASTFDTDERDRFLAGLEEIDSRSIRTANATFVEATETQRIDVLTGMEAEALKSAEGDSPPHFFDTIKSLTLFGYYTSEIGMTEELGWRMIPGSYDGCIDLAQPRPGGF
jgi:hypothetical protein